MVIAQVVFHGVVDVVVVICENNIVQLLDDARYFEACGITFEDPFVVSSEHAVGVVNAQGEIAVCRRVDLVVRTFWGIIGGGDAQCCTTAKHPGAKNRSSDNLSDGWLHVLDATPWGAGLGAFAGRCLAMLLAVLHQHCRAECCHS